MAFSQCNSDNAYRRRYTAKTVIAEQQALQGFVNDARYLSELVEEKDALDGCVSSGQRHLGHSMTLLTKEINRVWSTNCARAMICGWEAPIYPLQHASELGQSAAQVLTTATKKIMISADPRRKIVGRILGPRGLSLVQLEAKTECRIVIRGKGSVKDQEREESLRNRAGWEHLAEPLHLLVTATGASQEQCSSKLDQATRIIEELLAGDNDELKRRQLLQLAIINGTYREPRVHNVHRPYRPGRRSK